MVEPAKDGPSYRAFLLGDVMTTKRPVNNAKKTAIRPVRTRSEDHRLRDKLDGMRKRNADAFIERVCEFAAEAAAIADETAYRLMQSKHFPSDPTLYGKVIYWKHAASGLRWFQTILRGMVARFDDTVTHDKTGDTE